MVTHLVDMLSRVEDPISKAHAAGALANLCQGETNTPKMTQGGVVWCGGVSALVNLLASADPRVLMQATKGISCLAEDAGSVRQLLQYGALKPIIQLGHKCIVESNRRGGAPNQTLRNVGSVLRNLSKHKACRKQMVSEGAVEVLLKLWTLGRTDQPSQPPNSTKKADAALLECASDALLQLATDNSVGE
jgi:hypothetical protein